MSLFYSFQTFSYGSSTISSLLISLKLIYVLFTQGQLTSIMASGMEAGKNTTGEVIVLQKCILQVINETRYVDEILVLIILAWVEKC